MSAAAPTPDPDPGRHGWLNTYTGAKVFPLDFTPAMVRLVDLAHGLAGKMRYQAQTWLSVAQHSIAVLAVVERVVLLSKEEARFVLFHDGSEAYLPDMPAPIKNDARFAWFREIDDHVQACVYQAVGVDPAGVRPEVRDALKYADKMVRNTERRFFREVHPDWREAVPTPKPSHARPLSAWWSFGQRRTTTGIGWSSKSKRPNLAPVTVETDHETMNDFFAEYQRAVRSLSERP